MDNQVQSRKAKASAKAPQKSSYLLYYNFVSFVLWSVVTLRAVVLIPLLVQHNALHEIYDALFTFLRNTQTLALLEVVHAVLGLVRASPVTTAMQVASRLMLVWGVLWPYPELVRTVNIMGKSTAGTSLGPVALAGCHLAWGLTEMIRYGFFVWKEGVSENVPKWLLWLRYNTFFVLYPVGITSECLLVYLAATGPAADTVYEWAFKAILAIYVPGSYILYTHMMSQRRKVLKGKTKAN